MPITRNPFSHFLHVRRLMLRKEWKEILSNAYLSRATLHRIRNGDPHHPIAEVDSRRALAHALAFGSWDSLVAAFDAGNVKAGLPPPANGKEHAKAADSSELQKDAVVSLAQALNLAPTELVRRLAIGTPASDDELPSALRQNEKRPARLVPHFVSGVAASRRVEKLEDEDFDLKKYASSEDPRVFTIPVDGDCQSPVWNDGEIVLFSFDAYEREGILPGKSYYLAFTDGSTTFKRVFLDPEDPETYVLRCWNEAKYPGERRVHFPEVVRIARAMSKQIAPQE